MTELRPAYDLRTRTWFLPDGREAAHLRDLPLRGGEVVADYVVAGSRLSEQTQRLLAAPMDQKSLHVRTVLRARRSGIRASSRDTEDEPLEPEKLPEIPSRRDVLRKKKSARGPGRQLGERNNGVRDSELPTLVPRSRYDRRWSGEEDLELMRLREQRWSISQIALMKHCSRNAVTGRLHRIQQASLVR